MPSDLTPDRAWTIYEIREASTDELEAAFHEPSCEMVTRSSRDALLEQLRDAETWLRDSGGGIEEAERDHDPLSDYARGQRDAFYEGADQVAAALASLDTNSGEQG